MGGPRYVALALLAPVFGVPAALAAADPTPSLSAQHAVVRHAPARLVVRADVRARGAQRSTSRDTSGGRFVGRLHHPPAVVHLLAARLYWGRRPPAYPSTRSLRRDLGRTADYYDRVSRGREHVRVTLTRWVHVNASASTICDTEWGSIRAATAALRRAGYHPDRFNRLMLVTEQCNAAASAAQLPGRVSWIRFRSPGMPTLVHELGHNLGLEHAYGVVCRQGGQRVALGGSCIPVEYGDSWDAMGHSKGFFSAAALVRLGWAGRIADVSGSGTFKLADVQRSGHGNQALRIRAGGTTYWIEYQPEHSPQVGRTIPGVMIRREVGRGPVEMIDASPGNPAGIAYPDRDLTNPALPVGSSLTTPENIRITTLSTGLHAKVQVTFDQPAAAPDAPVVETPTEVAPGEYRVRWEQPQDNGQIVLGYRVTAQPGGETKYVRGPAGSHTSTTITVDPGAGTPTISVQALNQDGWSPAGGWAPAVDEGPTVVVTSPTPGAKVSRSFTVALDAAPDTQTHTALTSAWAEIGSVGCSVEQGAGPYTLTCTDQDHRLHGVQTLTVHVQDAAGVTTEASVPVRVRGRSSDTGAAAAR